MKLIIGIDFGTSVSAVRYKTEGGDTITAVKDADGKHDLIPTVIFRPEGEGAETLYGHLALSRANGGEPGELITNFKMGLLDADPAERERKMGYIVEFMRYLYQCFYAQVKGMTDNNADVFVSYPAKWPSDFVTFMKKAVAEAGFKGNIIGVPEPKAAAYNALYNHLKELTKTKLLRQGTPLNILLLDMGAGTSDIEIFRLKLNNSQISIDNVLSYPTIDNDALCGGREIDEAMRDIIINELQRSLPAFRETIPSVVELSSVKEWKEKYLSDKLRKRESTGYPSQVLKFLPMLPGGAAAAKAFEINREFFESQTRSHWQRLYGLLEASCALYQKKFGGNGAADIDLVLLTGGHSSWYTVPNLFNGDGVAGNIGRSYVADGKKRNALNFKKIVDEPWRILQDALPHESVALGLCRQDLGVDIPDAAANNVYVKMKVNEKESDYIQVVEIGQNLPVEIVGKEIGFKFENIKLQHVYDLTIEVLTGQSIENAERWTYRHHYDDRFGAVVATILFAGLPAIFGFDYNFLLRFNLKAEIDGTISFRGTIKKDKLDPVEIGF